MNYKTETLNSDVLIIGGGLAGARAAIEANKHGARVIMVMKGGFGTGGATALRNWIGGMNVPNGDTDPLDSPEEELKDILQAGEGMCNEELAKILVNETIDRANEMVKWGLDSIGKIDGKYSQIRVCFSSRPRTVRTNGLSIAPSALSVLVTQVRNIGVQIIENVMVAALLMRDKTCVGAIGINKLGDFIIVKAKSTVLATGGAAALFPRGMYPLDATGDGYALGFQAGAELFNMEFIQIGLGALHPVLLQLNPNISNVMGDKFLPRYLPLGVRMEDCLTERINHWPFSTRDLGKYVDIAIYKEIVGGRGTKNRGIYLDFTGIAKKDFDKSIQTAKGGAFGGIEKRLTVNGVNIAEKPVETIPCAHAFNGGFRINEKTETTVPGLYAVGETAGGPHGADRLGGNMLGTCLVFGTRAGKFAAERAKGLDEPQIEEKKVIQECDGITMLTSNKGNISTREIENKINNVMYKYCLTVRNQAGLTACIEELRRIKDEDIPALSTAGDNYRFTTLQIRNLLEVGKIVAYAALQRRESRGGHYREDYAERDDKKWLRTINITKEII